MPRNKTWEIHFLHREQGTLDDAYEQVSVQSKADAVKTGKAIAEQRNWYYMGIRLISEERRCAGECTV